MYIQIVGGRIYTPSGWIDGGSVLVEGKKIKAVLNTDLPIEGARTIDARGSYIIPGGIETHVHGAAGADYMDGTVEAFRTGSEDHLQYGTTTIYPTLSTSSYETIMRGIECTEVLMKDEESTVEGLHLEGPYFAVKMAGAQLPELIRPARPEEYTKIMERGMGIIKRWDAAPEVEGCQGCLGAWLYPRDALLQRHEGLSQGRYLQGARSRRDDPRYARLRHRSHL